MNNTNYQHHSYLFNTVSLKKQKFQIYSQNKEWRGAYKKKSSSLVSIYPSKAKQTASPQILINSKLVCLARTDKNKDTALNAYNHASSLNQSYVQYPKSTIDAVNQYAEKLRINLIKQQQLQQNIRRKQLKNNKKTSEDNSLHSIQQITSGVTKRQHFLSYHFNNIAHTTINLLYKSIATQNNQQKRSKFEFHISKLPIVDRLYIRKPQLIKKQSSIQLNIEQSQKVSNYNQNTALFTQSAREKPKFKMQKNPRQEENEIIPWATTQELICEAS